VFTHLPTEQLKKYFLQSEIIIARSGHTTIMDISALNKKAIFIPTPGQTEHEYLAEYFFNKKYFYYSKQNDFNLEEDLEKAKNFKGINLSNKPENIQRIIHRILEF